MDFTSQKLYVLIMNISVYICWPTHNRYSVILTWRESQTSLQSTAYALYSDRRWCL